MRRLDDASEMLNYLEVKHPDFEGLTWYKERLEQEYQTIEKEQAERERLKELRIQLELAH